MTQDVFIIRLARPDRLHERYFLTREAVVADILGGHIETAADIVAILKIDPDNVWNDETETVARAVAQEAEREQLRGSGGVSDEVHGFIHDYAGSAWTRGLKIVDRTFEAA